MFPNVHGGIMKSRVAIVSLVLIVVAGIGADGLFAQQAPIKRDFEAEIQAAGVGQDCGRIRVPGHVG